MWRSLLLSVASFLTKYGWSSAPLNRPLREPLPRGEPRSRSRPFSLSSLARDGRKTARFYARFESRLAFGGADADGPEEIATPTRQFAVWDATSGLPDDSREEDERQEERRLRDLRGRVKAARAVVSETPGLAETLAGDRRKAARFYARCGVTEIQFRSGVPTEAVFPLP